MTERQISLQDMSDIIEAAKVELMRLYKLELELMGCVHLARAALTDETEPPEQRIETALRFLRLGSLL